MVDPRFDAADAGVRERKAGKKTSTASTPANATANAPASKYTWQDVAQHNTAASAWVIIRGVVYDVTAWADRHPGGRELILLHAGRECTDTFDSYHPFSRAPDKVLAKYAIGTFVGPSEFPLFKPDTGFYRECARRVAAYFAENDIDPKSPYPGLWRMLVVLAVAAAAYAGMHGLLPVALPPSALYAYVWAVVFGVCQALPLLHVMHDSSHAAVSTSPTVWYLVGRGAMDWFAGACMTSWLNQHVVGHHIYTNVPGADPDLPVNFTSDVRRIVERQLLRPIYRFQQWYLPPLYGVLGIKFRLQDVWETFVLRTNGPIRVNPQALMAWISMFASKSFWAWFRIWVPLVVYKVQPATFWSVFLLAEFTTGWYLAFNFQVSHVSTECEYPGGDEAVTAIDEEWAIQQVKSSVDYAHGSWVTTFFAGALNYQVAHHLFPGVSQYHYPAMAPIIKDVCKKYKVEYRILPSFTQALLAHFRHLKAMGIKGQPVRVHMG